MGTNEKVWIEILTKRNEGQLRATFDHYGKVLCCSGGRATHL